MVEGSLQGNFHRFTFDVAISPQFSQCAAILFHPDGGILRGWAKCSKANDPLVGEAEAAIFALQIAHEFNFSSVLLEGDSKVVLDNLQSPFSLSLDIPWSIASLILSSRSLMLSFPLCSSRFISRAHNDVAHSVAAWAAAISFSGEVSPSFFLSHGLWKFNGAKPP